MVNKNQDAFFWWIVVSSQLYRFPQFCSYVPLLLRTGLRSKDRCPDMWKKLSGDDDGWDLTGIVHTNPNLCKQRGEEIRIRLRSSRNLWLSAVLEDNCQSSAQNSDDSYVCTSVYTIAFSCLSSPYALNDKTTVYTAISLNVSTHWWPVSAKLETQFRGASSSLQVTNGWQNQQAVAKWNIAQVDLFVHTGFSRSPLSLRLFLLISISCAVFGSYFPHPLVLLVAQSDRPGQLLGA